MIPFLGGETIAATAAFMVFLGALVFFARPGGALNRVLGALFLLHGCADVMYLLTRRAASAQEASLYHAVGHWYESALPLLTLLLLHHLVPPRGRARWRWWALGAAAVATLALSPLNGHEATFPEVPGPTGYHEEPSPWAEASLVFLWGARTAAVVVAAWAASSPTRGALQRRQAGLVGIAFLFLMGYSLIRQVGLATVGGEYAMWREPSTVVAALSAIAVLASIPRLVQPFDGPGRAAATVAAFVPFAAGATQVWLARMPWDVSTRPLMLAAYTACLAVAIVRYDLIGMGPRVRHRVEAFSRGMLAFGALLLPMGLALVLLGATSAGLMAALVLATGAVAISPAPARVLARGVTRVFAPDPLDPSVAAERARLYALALERHPDGSPELSRIRGDLGLLEADHHALARLLGPRDQGQPAREPPLLGRYVVQGELGRGAFGTAVLARDLATGREVVLKWFHAGWAEKRALAEAEALAKVRHPRVVPLLSVERAGERLFLVLEYVEGGSAQALLDATGRLPPARALALALDALEGLEAIHAAGIAHGDVKPANVLVDAHGRALLADLGAAQALSRSDADLTLTASPVVGTYATVAPEVLRGARRSAAADVYAMGATLYRLLSGEHYVPLEGADVVQATEAILHAPPRLPHPAIPPQVETILRRALAKAPQDRYASAAQMRQALAQASGETPLAHAHDLRAARDAAPAGA